MLQKDIQNSILILIIFLEKEKFISHQPVAMIGVYQFGKPISFKICIHLLYYFVKKKLYTLYNYGPHYYIF